MPKHIDMGDGTILEFPDSMQDEEIRSAIKTNYLPRGEEVDRGELAEAEKLSDAVAQMKAGKSDALHATRRANLAGGIAGALNMTEAAKTLVNLPYWMQQGAFWQGDPVKNLPPLISPEGAKSDVRQLLQMGGIPTPGGDSLEEGFERGAGRFMSGMTELQNLAAIALTKRFPAPVLGQFAGESIAALPGSIDQLTQAKTPAEAGEAIVGLTGDVAIPFGIGRGVREPLITERIPDARRIETPGTIHEDVPVQPVESAREMPVEESREGVQPHEATKAEERVQSAEEILKSAETRKGLPEKIAADVDSMTPEEFHAWTESLSKSGLGAHTQTAYKLGENAPNQEFVDMLKSKADEWKAKADEALRKLQQAPKEKADEAFREMSATDQRRQFFREAYERATGTASAAEPGYAPPFPVAKPTIPERFETTQDVLRFRQQRINDEISLYEKEMGLTKEEATRLQSLVMMDRDLDKFMSKLPPEKRKVVEKWFDESPYNKIGSGFDLWDGDTRFSADVERIGEETDKSQLASVIANAARLGIEQKPTSDRFIAAVLAARRLKEIGGTQSDLARYIDRYTTRESSIQGDKTEFFQSISSKVGAFLKSQNIELPEGDLGGRVAKPAEPVTDPIELGRTEPAPIPKAQKQVVKVAKTEGVRAAKDIKAELIDELQLKLQKAPAAADWKEGDGAKVTVEIPGDGTFTVKNTVEAISELIARAKKIKTDDKPPGVPKAAVRNSEDAIRASHIAEQDRLATEKLKAEEDARNESEVARLRAEPMGNDALEKHFKTWLETTVPKEDQLEVERGIRRLIKGDSSLLEHNGWPQLREMSEKVRWNPLPDEPPTPSTVGLGITPFPGAQAAVKGLIDWIADAPRKVKVTLSRLAGKSAPATSRASVESGNALIHYASSKIAAPLVARSMATDVLGSHHKDPAFGMRLGAVLVEDRLRAIREAFIQAGQPAEAAAVGTVIGKKWSPFQTGAQFRQALLDPEIKAAIDRHKASVQPRAEEAHQGARGELAGPGLHTGAFVNLKAILDGIDERLPGSAARGNLENPLRRLSRFFRQAKGTAGRYELDYRTLAERMITGNFEEQAKRQMYKQLVDDGLAIINNPGDSRPNIGGKPAVKFTIERRGTPMGEGLARTYIKNLWVRSDIASEVRQALNTDGPIGHSGLVAAANLLNRIQLAGPTDAVWHTVNMVGSIAGSPGGRTVLADLARQLPGVNILDAIGRTVASGIKVMRDSPEIQRDLAGLAEIGALRSQHKAGPIGRAVQFIDKAGRLVRNDMFDNLVRRGKITDTEANRREWVNQMGQYNSRLMGKLQATFKEAGFSPFVVAGRNFNRMGMRRLTLSPGVEAASPAAAAEMRAINAFGTIATIVAVPAFINYFTTGSPNGRPGVKQGEIDTGKDTKDGKHITIDPAQWTGLRRGLRISGAQAAIEGLRRDEGPKRITTQAAKDILGGIVHPWAGPAIRAGAVAGTGYDPQGYKESVDPKDVGENVKAALKQVNPVAEAILRSKEKDEPTAFKEIGKTLGGAVGIKMARAASPREQLQDLHQAWMRKSDDPKIRNDYERRQKETFVSDYKDLDHALRTKDDKAALAAIAKLRESHSDKAIEARMSPFHKNGTPKPLFHQNAKLEGEFMDTLDAKKAAIYDAARDQQQTEWEKFLEVWAKRP